MFCSTPRNLVSTRAVVCHIHQRLVRRRCRAARVEPLCSWLKDADSLGPWVCAALLSFLGLDKYRLASCRALAAEAHMGAGPRADNPRSIHFLRSSLRVFSCPRTLRAPVKCAKLTGDSSAHPRIVLSSAISKTLRGPVGHACFAAHGWLFTSPASARCPCRTRGCHVLESVKPEETRVVFSVSHSCKACTERLRRHAKRLI